MTDDLARFRTDIADWITDNCPNTLRGETMDENLIVWGGKNWVFKRQDQKNWMEAAIARGMTAPRWPTGPHGSPFPETRQLPRP